MRSLVLRNLKVFFRDKGAVFFSLLGVIIVIGLYALFLGNVMVSSFPEKSSAAVLVDNWLVAGLIAITSLTASMGALGTLVEDKSRKIVKDFMAAPLKQGTLGGAYVTSTFVVGFALSLLALVLGQGYILLDGGQLLTVSQIGRLLGVMVMGQFFSSSFCFFVVSFLKSSNAYAAASTVLGTLAGFLTGTYLSIGMLPEGVQWIIKLFPLSHVCALMRQIFTETAFQDVFAGAPTAIMEETKSNIGVVLFFRDHAVTAVESVIFVVLAGLLFFGFALYNFLRKRK